VSTAKTFRIIPTRESFSFHSDMSLHELQGKNCNDGHKYNAKQQNHLTSQVAFDWFWKIPDLLNSTSIHCRDILRYISQVFAHIKCVTNSAHEQDF
jgi:hypothetical protein